MLSERVHIARRFLRSICIDTDLTERAALEGFICPQSSTDVLLTMARHVSETGQGAFTWTGPYGSGKSSLVVALSALLNGSASLRAKAQEIFGQELTSFIGEALPSGTKGWRVVPVVGVRDDAAKIIGEAVRREQIAKRRPRDGWNGSNLVRALTDAAEYKPETYGGLVLFIDEMGKFLEAAVRNGSDIYVFQQLAEAASRSKGRLLVIGILHQSFEEYTHRLSHEMRDEWAKIQGRFIDLVVNATGEEQVELIARAIQSDQRPDYIDRLCDDVAGVMQQNNTTGATRLASRLSSCWPLHPVVVCLLGSISRRRFGQNQRSLFGFLNSSERYGFQDFLKQADDTELYTPAMLWNYLRANLEPSILASPDGHRWALAAEAIERCESLGGDLIHIELLKTIAVVDLFKEHSGLVANLDILKTCFHETADQELQDALSKLNQRSFTIFKKFLEAHAIFAGSDFDIDQATRATLEATDEIDFKALKALAGLQPILAKRHYHETGAFRWFEINVVPLSDLDNAVICFKPESSGAVGQFLLVIPSGGESEDEVRDLCREAANDPGSGDSLFGASKTSWSIIQLARELLALERVSDEYPELAGDAVARREVSARMASLQSLLETELHKSFDNASWFGKKHSAQRLRQTELNNLASELADNRFSECPRLHNELLNRRKPSGSATAAQNALLRAMVLKEGEPRLGISGFPAEGGLFYSVLKESRLYRQNHEKWQFMSPEKGDDPCRLIPLWQAALAHVRENADRPVTIAEIFNLWRRPPFGVIDGLLPVLSVAFILSLRDKLAIYREGLFKARFDDVDIDYLTKDEDAIQVRWMDLSEVARQLLSEMAAIVRELDEANRLAHLEPIDVARGLVAIYDKLPQWTKRTMRLSANAVCIRDMFKRARDPNKFLFDDIPETLGQGISQINEQALCQVVNNVRDGLAELVHAYPSMMRRLRDLMLAELQVPNISPQSLAELRDRALNIRQIAGDFKFEAFIGRLLQLSDKDSAFEDIASLAAGKPPRDWVDTDLDRTTVELARMAQEFLRIEAFARVKGRQDKRHAMAVVVGMDGRPTPVHDEFTVTDLERNQVDKLIKQVDKALKQSKEKRRNIILAALAELSAKHLKESAAGSTKAKQKKRKAS